MHRDTLRTQWRDSLYKLQGLTSEDVYEIETSEELEAIANGHDPNYDIYLMTHATFRAGLKRIRDLNKMANIPRVLGIGLKIIDEAHLEFRDTLMMDFVFNIQRNLYLTATDGRSSKNENIIFRHVFSNALFYKPSSLLSESKPKKWVEYNVVEINTNANPKIVKFRVEGYRGKMSPASYGKWVIQYDKKQTHIKCVTDIVKMIYERDPSAKVLIFMPLIDLCIDTSYYLHKHLNYDESFPYDLNIQTINSKNSKSENEANKHADVIVTTIGSCGTGTDIPGITAIISCSPYVSSLTAKQTTWRLRYCGKRCYYYDIYDSSVRMDKIWIKSRSKTISSMAIETKYLQWEPDETDSK
jgi:superfamily II DNA or RNA helicase